MAKGFRVYRDLAERLLANSVLCLDTECWLWVGRTTKDGYGLINIRVGSKHVTLRAHRASYEEFTGAKIGTALELDHTCHTRHCIHPNHVRPVPKHTNLANRRGYRTAHAY